MKQTDMDNSNINLNNEKSKSIYTPLKGGILMQNFTSKSKSTHRIQYEAEVEAIKKQIGDIENIRENLGLSARKMAQLLLVDPSAWTRWSQRITPPPPHIYRALQWYLALQEKNPGFTPQFFLSTQTFAKGESQKELLNQLQKIQADKTQESNRWNEQNEKINSLEKRLEYHRKWIQLLLLSLIFILAVWFFKNFH